MLLKQSYIYKSKLLRSVCLARMRTAAHVQNQVCEV